MKNWKFTNSLNCITVWYRHSSEKVEGMPDTLYSKEVNTGTVRASDIYGNNEEEANENARLVIAAPQMLEALQFVAENIGKPSNWDDEILEKVKKAIEITKVVL